LLGAYASTTKAGISADASGTAVNASTSTTTTTPISETTAKNSATARGTP
jgi:hypothetical protein